MVKSLDHINIYPLISPVHFILSGLLENINAEVASMGSRFDVFNKIYFNRSAIIFFERE